MTVTTALILAPPQDSEPFCIEADSSDFASRAILSQQLPGEEKWHPVAFYNKSLSLVMGIKRFDHKTKVKARSERRNSQTASQLCTKQVGTGEINQIIESLLKVNI